MQTVVIAFIGSIILVAILVGRWFFCAHRYLRYINRYPNEAYDFFMSNTERWVVYETDVSPFTAAKLPSADGLPQGKLLGPFQFCVPKRQGRLITVYGKAKGCIWALDDFVLKMKKRH